jgi:LacI family transcriptional regulator
MMRRPTRNDVARHARVSGATVSRVLSGRRDLSVSDQTRARVVAAAERLGYRPNQAARSLVTGRTHTVGLWTIDCFTPYYARLAACVSQLAARRHYRVAVEHFRSYLAAQEEGVRPVPWQVDAILACDLPLDPGTDIASLVPPGTPIITIGTYHAAEGDFVGVDLYAGAVEVMAHLLRQGCRRVAYLVYPRDFCHEDPRTRAYVAAMKAAALEPKVLYIDGYGRAFARQAVREKITGASCPDAIFCHNDDAAIGCYRGLYDLGIRVPQDVLLVGCDGIEEIEYLECPLTTIVQPVEAMCSRAWEFLERRIKHRDQPPQQAVLPAELVIRASSRRGGAADGAGDQRLKSIRKERAVCNVESEGVSP